MRVTGRLTQPQKIVVIIALALALGVVGNFLGSLRFATRFPGSAVSGVPVPYQSTLSVALGLPSWAHLLIWLALIAVWLLLSIRILRPRT